jgi:hypothetical protein
VPKTTRRSDVTPDVMSQMLLATQQVRAAFWKNQNLLLSKLPQIQANNINTTL